MPTCQGKAAEHFIHICFLLNYESIYDRNPYLLLYLSELALERGNGKEKWSKKIQKEEEKRYSKRFENI